MSKCEIRGSETQSFSVLLESEQYARFVVERQGIDLSVSVASPDRRSASRFENPAGEQSPIIASVVTNMLGEYTVEVRPLDKWAATGSYLIRFEDSHASSPSDEKRLAAGRRLAEGRRLQLLDTSGSRLAAIAEYEASLALWEELGDNFEAANTLHYMAQTYKAHGVFDKSVGLYGQALERRAGDPHATAYTLLDLAAARVDMRELPAARSHYENALELFRQAQNRRGEAATLYGIGLSHMYQRNMTQALESLRPALALHRAEGDRHEVARTLNAMGGAYDNLSNPQEARKLYEEAIEGWEATGDLTQKGNTLNGLAKLDDDSGDWQKALERYHAALDCYDASEKSVADVERYRASIARKRANTIYNIGSTYVTLGDWVTAEKYLLQSLEYRNTKRGEGVTHGQLAYAYVQAGNSASALEHCQKALTLLEGDASRAQVLTVRGMIYDAQGERALAIDVYQEAHKLQQNDLQGRARTLTKLAEAHAALGKRDEALGYFGRARELWHSFGERDGEALTLFGAARVERARGNPEAALKQVEAALELTEPLRANVTNRQVRASYFATKISYYELYIDLKMRNGDVAGTAAAFTASERARARSLLDLLSDARVEKITDADSSLNRLVEKRRLLLLEMRAATKRRAETIAAKKGEEAVAAIDREVSMLDANRDRVEAQIRAAHPRYAALMFPQPLSAAEVQRLLDPDTLLLEFFLGDDASYLWAVTPTHISGHRLPPRSEIEAAAQRLKDNLSKGKPRPGETAAERHARLTSATSEYWQEAATLSRTLLGPVAAQLKGKRLLVVADGALMYLPFGALPSPEVADRTAQHTAAMPPAPAPLIRDHVVVNLPSASVLSALRQTARRRRAPKSVAVFSDPVVEENDSRVKEARRSAKLPAPGTRRDELTPGVRDMEGDIGKLSRLPSTFQEAQDILSVAPGGSPLNATGFEANREKATDPQLGQYSVVHFATHGILNEKRPELSGLVLSLYDKQGRFRENGFLSLGDIYSLSLPVDLVVLSACRTGLGKEVRGEGLIGLTRGFMYAGAPRVVASLWQVDDKATAGIMKHFYLKMFKEGMSPAAALRAAQVFMAGQKRWSSPYYWAGFVLQGEWK